MTVRKFLKKKLRGEKIVMITAYDTPTARLVDEAGVDSILVGDSMAMVVLGMKNTLGITLETMIEHTMAVARAEPRALVIGDMPFMSYEQGPVKAMESAAMFARAGADAVKLEGGEEVVDQIKAIIRAGIPVLGHIGLTPQRFLKLGGYRLIGKKEEEQKQLMRDALLLEEAGVFGIVLENVVADIARQVTERLSIPTICIGSGPYCDGQVLVIHDVLGLSQYSPPFAKKYVDLSTIIVDAVKRYSEEVRKGLFPGPEHYHTLKKD